MTSSFGWLAAGQFRDETTSDDLVCGAIRDPFCDALFPGTSTLHTRLRYVLFIPGVRHEAIRRDTTNDRST